jgi:hypothetical protein
VQSHSNASDARKDDDVDKEVEGAGPGLSKRMTANLIAAALGALATAFVESPVELFRHQAQVQVLKRL